MEANEKRTGKTAGTISKQTIRRLPYYLKYLKDLDGGAGARISACAIAASLGLSEVLVRKDLAAVSSVAGRPRLGFRVQDLIADIERFLGYHNSTAAILVGAGHLGKALLSYRGFAAYGLEIAGAFDADKGLYGKEVGGHVILPMQEMPALCRRLEIKLGIITVPADAAQQVCDRMVENGVRAVWNFAPAHLSVPEGILVQNENIAASLVTLSNHLAKGENK